MIYDDKDSKTIAKQRLQKKLSVVFENIKRIDEVIVGELEKRVALAEDCAGILLNSDSENNFSRLLSTEELVYDYSYLFESIIKENIFPCGYILNCIDTCHHLIEYMKYQSEANTNVGALSVDIHNKNNISVRIELNSRLTLNKVLLYIALCEFDITKIIREPDSNKLFLSLNILSKSRLFDIFLNLIKCYDTEVIITE